MTTTTKINQHQDIILGCDPEFFFTKNGDIIGSEKIIPEGGLVYEPDSFKGKIDGRHTTRGNMSVSKIIIDGVQAEINPRPNTCRANLANEISCCMRTVYEAIKNDQSLSCNFEPAVSITPEELKSLSEKSQQFGCSPSKNTKGKSEISIKDASKYYYRSAGGHIHLGSTTESVRKALQHPELVIPVLDIILGNTCVLIDRNDSNIERRKVYGMAGEYRTPPHGLEYRTLSNFWLRNYSLMSMVFGIAQQCVQLVEYDLASKTDNVQKLFSLVDMGDIHRAINENNKELAQANFDKVINFFADCFASTTVRPISNRHLKEFKFFLSKDLDYWFDNNILDHWVKLPEGHGTGFETFIDTVVKSKMK